MSIYYVLGVMGGFTDDLGTIVEFSIGLAGFAGIVAALMRNSTEIIRFRFLNLLTASFVPGFIALIVIGSSYTAIPTHRAALIGSCVLILFIVSFATYALTKLRTLPFGDDGLSKGVLYSFLLLAVSTIILQICGIIFFRDYIEAVLYFGLVMVLVMGAVSFVALALGVLDERG